ncbi:nuclear receptor 2C2-associated protein-like [Haliotis rubra]|uniref:nuclear receptor 2C2-associated protein-like n=1 Tax=Haliotis rubra TaxID=36100 RepID=UPI001EE56A41|nr:nuclear receptor 2C2-associated protein-like [Haliotis rubra]
MLNMAASLLHAKTQIRVSSVLNRDIKQFGKKYLTDGEEDTCWNSDQGCPQWILVDFEHNVKVKDIQLQFQGGFAGKECWVETGKEAVHLTKTADFYPEDINSLQTFKLSEEPVTKVMRIVFNSSTDFFGRITLYKLDILGEPC